MARTTEAANSETSNNNKALDSVTGGGAQCPEPLARIGGYVLLHWERCIPPVTGRVGVATVLMPRGKFGGLSTLGPLRSAESWPTSRLRRIGRRDWPELHVALPFAVALVRQFDPEALSRAGSCWRHPLRMVEAAE